MRAAIWTGLVSITITLAFATAANAWPARPGGTVEIAVANKSADTGDYFSVEGDVISTQKDRIFKLRDDTGEMWVLLPEFLTRDKGVPAVNERILIHLKGKVFTSSGTAVR